MSFLARFRTRANDSEAALNTTASELGSMLVYEA